MAVKPSPPSAGAPGPPSATRERLLATAARLFHEGGYHATGIAAILRAAGLHAGSLYHFFAGKEELLCGVLAWYREQLRPVLIDPVEAVEQDPVERVFLLLAFYRRALLESDFELGCRSATWRSSSATPRPRRAR